MHSRHFLRQQKQQVYVDHVSINGPTCSARVVQQSRGIVSKGVRGRQASAPRIQHASTHAGCNDSHLRAEPRRPSLAVKQEKGRPGLGWKHHPRPPLGVESGFQGRAGVENAGRGPGKTTKILRFSVFSQSLPSQKTDKKRTKHAKI